MFALAAPSLLGTWVARPFIAMGESPKTTKRAAVRRAIAALGFAAAVLILLGNAILPTAPPRKEVPYSELLKTIEEGRVEKAIVGPDEIVVQLRGTSERLLATRPPRTEDPRLLTSMRDHDVILSAEADALPWWRSLLAGFGPLLFLLMMLFAGAAMTSGLTRPSKPLTFVTGLVKRDATLLLLGHHSALLLCDRLRVLFGGRSAEEIVCPDVSTGAENDLEQASELARRMVLRFGMSDRLGAQTFGLPSGGRYLLDGSCERNYAEATARVIDDEVRGLLEREHRRARTILDTRCDTLQAIAKELLARETIERAELETIVAKHPERPTFRAASA